MRLAFLLATSAAIFAASLQVRAQELPRQDVPGIQDKVLVRGQGELDPADEDAVRISGVNGRLAVNLAVGSGNQQMNDAVVAIGQIASDGGYAHQLIQGPDTRDRATRIALEGDAFANISGLASVNIAAGVQNQSANLAVLSIGNHGALSEQLLSQTRASIEPSGSPGGTENRNDTIEISETAFRNGSGLIQVNLIGGERNSSANTFVLSVLGEGSP